MACNDTLDFRRKTRETEFAAGSELHQLLPDSEVLYYYFVLHPAIFGENLCSVR